MRKILTAVAGIAALAVIGLPSAASASVHPGATAACSSNCSDFSSLQLGPGVLANAYVAHDTGVVPSHGGQKINFRYGDNAAPNQDFLVEQVGYVGQYCRSDHNPDGQLFSTSVACLSFRSSPVYELDWAPFGQESGYCAGTTGTPFDGKNVVLTRCGTTEGSLFIQQNDNAGPSTDNCANGDDTGPDYSAYISGATTSFSHPEVASVNLGSSRPANQVTLQSENLVGGQVRSAELFCFQQGSFR